MSGADDTALGAAMLKLLECQQVQVLVPLKLQSSFADAALTHSPGEVGLAKTFETFNTVNLL